MDPREQSKVPVPRQIKVISYPDCRLAPVPSGVVNNLAKRRQPDETPVCPANGNPNVSQSSAKTGDDGMAGQVTGSSRAER